VGCEAMLSGISLLDVSEEDTSFSLQGGSRSACYLLTIHFVPENEGKMLFPNADKFIPDYTESSQKGVLFVFTYLRKVNFKKII
jgi:hypothetical protein